MTPPPAHYAPWTDGEDAHLLEHWSYRTDERLAADLGRTRQAVHARARDLGLAGLPKAARRLRAEEIATPMELLNDGYQMTEVAAPLRMSPHALAAVLKRAERGGFAAFPPRNGECHA